MSSHGLSDQHLTTIKQVLAPYGRRIEKVGLFGSRATGKYRDNSDIDMVIYGGLTEPEIDRLHTMFEESLLPYRVDVNAYHLVEYATLKAHIDATMQPLSRSGGGVMNEWKNIILDDVTTSINTGLDAIRRAPIVSHKTDLRCLRIQDISNTKPFSEWGYTETKDIDYQKYRLKKNDIIMARTCSTGINYLVKDDMKAVFNNGLARIRLDLDRAHPAFFYYVFQSKEFADYISGISGGTSVQLNMKVGDLAKYEFKLPPKNAQKVVAKVLGDLDDKIAINQQINRTLESMAQAVFKSWFVDFDPTRAKMAALEAGGTAEDATIAAMTAISGKSTEELAALKTTNSEAYAELHTTASLFPSRLVESELGEIPEEWEVKGLDGIASYLNGLALQKFRPKDEHHYLPVLKIAQLKKGSADNKEKASPDIKPEYIVQDGDVVFSWSGSLMVDVWCGGKVALNQHLFKVTSEKYPKWLFYYFIKHHLVEFQRIAADKAVTMGHIKRMHLTQALCAVPKLDDDVMKLGNRVIGDNLAKQIELRLESQTLTQLRDSLLPKLLSGEISVDEINNEEAT